VASLLRDFSLSALVAGFVAVLVGFTSSAAIVFQAAQALGATPEQIGSWILALGVGMGATCIGLSLRHRAPVLTAWSTPGAAMLITGAAGVPMAEAIGAFLACGALIALAGFGGWFERAMHRIPMSIGSAMLAGVLLRFGLDVFVAMQSRFGLVAPMFGVWLLARRLAPRYAVLAALVTGLAVAGGSGLIHWDRMDLQLARPVPVMPSFSLAALVGVALPLFVVTMASQNVPGVAALRACGYERVPVSPVIGWTGIATLLLAPFGAYALNLAAITAAICMGPEAHPDPRRRYVAAVAAGGFYLLAGLFGATVAALFAALPRELVLGIAGVALFGTIAAALAGAMAREPEREPALATFLVTASGMTLAGIGSAFWGLVAGAITLLVLRARR
jgi:benzoate membrane transport protein